LKKVKDILKYPS